MERISKRLLTILMNHEGKNFDATLQDDIEGLIGFSFMSYIKTAKIHIQAERITVSEPVTGKYFCLPINGIKEIHVETYEKYDVAFTVKYNNDYNVFIQIFEPF